MVHRSRDGRGVTMPYDELVSVTMVESALELIVKHIPRNQHGEKDSPPKHLWLSQVENLNQGGLNFRPKRAHQLRLETAHLLV